MKNQIQKLFAIMAMALVCVGASAQSDIDNEIDKLLSLQDVRQTMIDAMSTQFQALVKMGQIAEAKAKTMAEECADVMVPKCLEIQKKLYKEYYTLEELKELNKFYASAVGQKTLKLAVTFSSSALQVAADPEVMKKIQEITMKHLMPQ
ncbi:MAG: DUF2059 domain-containing protein [Bacteroidales bacterium]|nr:DUF2059 domain-containing protein [Bacteroidales bacterium]